MKENIVARCSIALTSFIFASCHQELILQIEIFMYNWLNYIKTSSIQKIHINLNINIIYYRHNNFFHTLIQNAFKIFLFYLYIQ